jgi:glutamate/tyrosine decarboxylase-like PLP-dependent enzyme
MPLPIDGRDWKDLEREMRELKRDDLDWRRGRHAAYVWHADDEVEEVVRQAHALFMTENGLGLRAFPSLRQMEGDVVAIVADLVGSVDSVAGHMTTGGTESIFCAVHAAREWARRHRPEVALPEVVAPFSAHPALDKAAHYLGMRVVRVPTRPDFRADVEALAAAVTPRTAMCYVSAPTYSLGLIDPIAAAGELAAAQGLWLHVDACVGGVLAPFVRRLGFPVPEFGFRVPGVTSMSVDVHKSGYAAKGASVVLFRTAEHQAAGRYDFDRWPSGLYSTHTFVGTRPGGAIAAAWAVLQHLGERGYLRIAETVMRTRESLLAALGGVDPDLHVWGAPDLWAVGFGARGYDIHAVADRLAARGWWPGRIREPRGIHLMITPVHAAVIEEYLADLAAAVREVKATGAAGTGKPVYS